MVFSPGLFPEFLRGASKFMGIGRTENPDGLSSDEKIKGSSLNHVGEVRQRIWPLFLCASVVGSVHRGSPLRHKRYARSQTLFAIFVSFVVYTRRRSV